MQCVKTTPRVSYKCVKLDVVAFPSNGCKIVHTLLGKADLCKTHCEAAKGRRQCSDKQVTKAHVDGNVLVEARCQSDNTILNAILCPSL